MTNQLLVAIFVTICCLYSASAKRPEGPAPGGNNLWDLRVYRIEAHNVTDKVLTAAKSNQVGDSKRIILATTAVWTDDSSQKWRLDSSGLYDSFALHLTSNENFELEYDDTRGFFSSLWAWGFGYNRYWYFIDGGNGYHMIRNHYNKVCLKANGLDNPVSTEKCDNSVPQQWKLVFLSGLPSP